MLTKQSFLTSELHLLIIDSSLMCCIFFTLYRVCVCARYGQTEGAAGATLTLAGDYTEGTYLACYFNSNSFVALASISKIDAFPQIPEVTTVVKIAALVQQCDVNHIDSSRVAETEQIKRGRGDV